MPVYCCINQPATTMTDLQQKYINASIIAQYEVIVEALKQSNFRHQAAAELLGIDRKTLYKKLKAHKRIMSETKS
jgi:two-component system, NtrC family, response regulator HydG